MIQPTGPLPVAVYWRRRAAALTGLVLILLLLVWLVATVAGGQPGPREQPAAQQQGTTAEPTPATTDPSAAVTPSSSAAESSASSSALPPDTSSAPSAPPPSSPPPPGPPQPCPDETTVVTAQPEQPEYRVGAKPVFRLAVANTGTVPCTRDLDAGLQELLVFAADGTTRLWSSNDCYPGDSIDVRVLQPGENVTFTVTWAGRSSRPQCAGQRVQVPAGDYLVVAKLGPLTSPPAPFKLIH